MILRFQKFSFLVVVIYNHVSTHSAILKGKEFHNLIADGKKEYL